MGSGDEHGRGLYLHFTHVGKQNSRSCRSPEPVQLVCRPAAPREEDEAEEGEQRAELGVGSFPSHPEEMGPSGSLAWGCPRPPGSGCWASSSWAARPGRGGSGGSGLAEDPPDPPSPPQKFGFANRLRQAGSRSGRRRSKVVPSVCVRVRVEREREIKAIAKGSSSFLALAGLR